MGCAQRRPSRRPSRRRPVRWALALGVLCSLLSCGRAPQPVDDDEPGVVGPAPPTRPPLRRAEVGQPAPPFDLLGVDGRRHALAELKGKVTVLEWFNPDCADVQWVHGDGPLKDMAERYHQLGVAWVAINSAGPGGSGFGMARNRRARDRLGLLHPLLLDEDGEVGHLYRARRTPEVFVIDRRGVLVYAGGVDNIPYGDLARPGEEPTAHLDRALSSVLLGQRVPVSRAPAWGCPIAYER